MNPIREFFKKKTKFRNAGPGRTLGSPSTSSSSGHPPPVTRQPKKASHHEPSEVSKRAAEAAIARAEQKQNNDVNWALAAVKAQARKELEFELQAAEKEKNQPKLVYQEGCSLLAVNGVFYCCPLIGPDILPYKEIKVKIKEFLYSQLEEEQGLTSCLIIHSCNNDREKVKICIETLSRYLTNIMENPTEEKYRKIRLNNKAFQERVACLEGALDFLLACGFVQQKLQLDNKEEDYFIFPEELLADLDNIQMMKEALYNAEPIRPELDRNKRLLMSSQSTEKINLPSDFFNLSSEELIREQESRTHAVELNSQLRTKAMKERDEIRELHMYKYSLVRIRFPNGLILQGTFSVREKLNSVKDFIVDNLANPHCEFILLAPGAFKLEENESTLLELKLIPAVLLNLNWVEDDLKSSEACLKSETMALLQNL